jgi:hypothetical protein
MGNDIECYRTAIGLFNLCKWNHVRSYKRSCTSILEILLTNFRCTFLVASLTVLQTVNPNIDSSLFRILRIFILQIASDLSVFTTDVFDISFVNGPRLT